MDNEWDFQRIPKHNARHFNIRISGYFRIQWSEFIIIFVTHAFHSRSVKGTFIAAYATIDTYGVRYAYSLDGEDPVIHDYSGASQTLYRAELFHRPDLNDTQHELKIVLQSQNQSLWLDYLSYIGRAPPSGSMNGSDNIAADSMLSSPPNNKLAPGTIVAIVLGSVFSLTLVAVLIVFASRRWHRLRLIRPRQHQSSNEKAFEIMPSVKGKITNWNLNDETILRLLEPSPGTKVVSTKAITYNRGVPASQNTTVLSTSLFSSVVFNYTYDTSSVDSV
jgi:hypothetical protein